MKIVSIENKYNSLETFVLYDILIELFRLKLEIYEFEA